MDAKKKSRWLKILGSIGAALVVAGTIFTGGAAAPIIAAGKAITAAATTIVSSQPETTPEPTK